MRCFGVTILFLTMLAILAFLIIQPVYIAEEVQVSFQKGSTFQDLTTQLHNHNIVQSPFFFSKIAVFFGYDKQILPGTFIFQGWLTTYSIFTRLKNPIQELTTLTIPEGFTYQQIQNRLLQLALADSSSAEVSPTLYQKIIPFDIRSPEGYLFPETYFFHPEISTQAIYKIMLETFVQKLPADFFARCQELQLTPNEVITLASIVEKEAIFDEEKPTIAGVYFNRLKRNMLLQADPTVQYALGKHRKKLYYKHLEVDSPYNTYKYKGLPPTPIANPGTAAINAVLHPENNDYLYFFADGHGKHIFSHSYQEHLRKQRHYR